jgi:uncharacterized protein YndB with AHSA1/START domain
MTPTPSGRITRLDDGSHQLVVTRIFASATIDDVRASVTESERTARWYGAWRGEPGVGKTIEVQMAYEEGAPWIPMTIDKCDPPHTLAVSSSGSYGSWFIEVSLRESATAVILDLIQHRLDPGMAGEVGPGWEYYLDNLVASRDETAQPSFDDYYPQQAEYYRNQVEAQEPG